jgi:hypothetical protein
MVSATNLPTEIIGVGNFQLDWMPFPGNFVEVNGSMYRVIERKHRYLFQRGKYQLWKMVLEVQKIDAQEDRQTIGDPTCLFNAHSEFLRCAVNPKGICENCSHYQPAKPIAED